jgi:SAM-dependent methyltransferase
MEEIKCIFCDLESTQIVIEEDGYKGRKCERCSLIYISPRPTGAEIQYRYRDNKAKETAAFHISEEFDKRLHAKHNLKIIRKFISGGSMLEIGPGAGYFLDESREQGFRPYAIELNHILVDFINSQLMIPCEDSPLSASSFNGKVFDVIYHSDVISHLPYPVAALQAMNERLKEDGLLVFVTGNLGDVKPRYYKHYPSFLYPDHLFFFSEGNLESLLIKTGFELMEIYAYNLLPQMIVHDLEQRIVKCIKSKSEVNTKNTHADNHERSPETMKPTNAKRRIKKMLKITYEYLLYILCYKVGYIVPKKGRPQRLIIVARKIA